MDISHQIRLLFFFNIIGIFYSGVVLATDPSHTVITLAKLLCLPGAVSHTQSLFHGFPDQILDRDSAIIKDISILLWTDENKYTGLH